MHHKHNKYSILNHEHRHMRANKIFYYYEENSSVHINHNLLIFSHF